MLLKSLAIIALALVTVACDQQPSQSPGRFTSTEITGVPWGQDFDLTDHLGRPRKLADFRGKAVMLFFGYTNCPDICPVTMAKMASVVKDLGDGRQRVQGLFVTLDPVRDTAQALKSFVTAFNPDFLGLTGEAAAITALAKEFKMFVAVREADPQGRYDVAHGGGVFVFDASGRLRLFMRDDLSVDVMTADLTRLLRDNRSL